MAGFVTRDIFPTAGYTASKTGVIALTRSFESSVPNVFKTEWIKAYALCPYFANTQLVRDRIAIEDLEKEYKVWVIKSSTVALTPSEIKRQTLDFNIHKIVLCIYGKLSGI